MRATRGARATKSAAGDSGATATEALATAAPARRPPPRAASSACGRARASHGAHPLFTTRVAC